jgi:hypothetical protein
VLGGSLILLIIAAFSEISNPSKNCQNLWNNQQRTSGFLGGFNWPFQKIENRGYMCVYIYIYMRIIYLFFRVMVMNPWYPMGFSAISNNRPTMVSTLDLQVHLLFSFVFFIASHLRNSKKKKAILTTGRNPWYEIFL